MQPPFAFASPGGEYSCWEGENKARGGWVLLDAVGGVGGADAKGRAMAIRVLAWSEGTEPEAMYPLGIRGAVAEALRGDDFDVRTGTISDPRQGVVLDDADVLVWWGHAWHAEVADELAGEIAARVRGGMGLLALHSSHHSKPFRAVLECSGDLGGWREAAELERCPGPGRRARDVPGCGRLAAARRT